MGDIQKINVIHDVKKTFKLDKEFIDKLISQLDVANNINRFFSGLDIEKNFKLLFSGLPYIKEINGLDQEQLKSKEQYQVPDYIVLFENYKLEVNSVLIEVKSVTGDKQSLELMRKQVIALMNYARDSQKHLLFAIFWKKWNCWTINSVKNFIKKTKKYKITFLDALKNDISSIFGDLSYIIKYNIYRKTIFDPNTKRPTCDHNKYGKSGDFFISLDKKNWSRIDLFENAFIDSSIEMCEIEKEIDFKKRVVIIEQNKGNFLGDKKSSLILQHISSIRIGLEYEVENIKISMISNYYIDNFIKKMKIMKTVPIPHKKNDDTNFLYKFAFCDSSIWNTYTCSQV